MVLLRCSMVLTIFTVVAFLNVGPHATAGGKTSSVTGKITLDGKPIADGKIFFYVGDDQFVGAKTQKDGTFKIDRIPAGTHKVAIEGKGVPARYGSQSVLVVSVADGANQHDFELRSK